jgi:nucleotide-binding universal stress UspA family protein
MTRPVVLAGVDGSPNSIAALRRAAAEADGRGAVLRVVYAYPQRRLSGQSEEAYREATGDDVYYACQVIERCIHEAACDSADDQVERVPVAGNARDVLTGMSASADLLVVGLRGHSLGVGIPIGRTAQACRAGAGCPVLVVDEAEAPDRSGAGATVRLPSRIREGS